MRKKSAEQDNGYALQYISVFDKRQAERLRSQRVINALAALIAAGISISVVTLALNYYADARLAASQQTTQRWSTEISGQLRGEMPLHPNQRSFDNVRVVPSGFDYNELLFKKRNGEPVNVTIFVNAQQPKISAQIRQDTIVARAVIDDSQSGSEIAAFLCEPQKDNLIPTPDPQSNQSICLIPLDNLERVRN